MKRSWIAIAALAAAAFVARLVRLASSSEPFGTDGYYYVVQVERLLSTGRLHAPDGSWVLLFLAAAAAPLRDPVLGVKLGESLLAALCVPAAWFAGARLGGKESPASGGVAAGVTLAAWAAVSPTIGQLAAEFPKSLGVVPPALAAIALAAGRPRGVRLVLLVACTLAAATAHRIGAALAAAAIVGQAVGAASRGRAPGRSEALRLVAAAAVAIAAFTAATLVLPNLLHPADLDRLRGQVRLAPGLPPPLPYLALRGFGPAQVLELTLPWAAAALAIVAWVRRPEARPAIGALAAPLAACLLPVWRDDVLDLGYRLSLTAPAIAAPLAIAAWPPRRPAQGAARVTALAAAAALLAFPAARLLADPAALPPYARFRRVIASIPRPLPDLLIAHQGMAFLYDHETGSDAMAWAPEPALDRRTVGRIAWGIRAGEWGAFAPDPAAAVVPLDRDYAYVREDVWEAFVERARAEGDDDLSERLADWRNPSAVRPRSLARNHR